MLIKDLGISDIKDLNFNISSKLNNCENLEEAANIFTEEVYNAFKESIVLARLCVTIRFSKLPKIKRDFVSIIYSKVGLPVILDKNDFILTLFGEAGEKELYDISNSEYQAIPVKLIKHKEGIKEFFAKNIDDKVKVFFIEDAHTSEDNEGKKIIQEQTFVNKYNIKSAFAFGGKYPNMEEEIMIIIYTNEKLTKQHAVQFFCFGNTFKEKTKDLLSDNLYFKPT